MSTATEKPAAHSDANDAAPGGHDPHLAHHFETREQQVGSEKVGMWMFLATEIIMFGGLFCVYAAYRGNHSDVFLYAHRYLDTSLGAINTGVLLTSSLTMAWAVRAAQLNQKKLLSVLLALTLLGGCGFMVIKTIEYKAKFSHDLWPGKWNLFYHDRKQGFTEEQLAAIAHLEAEYGLEAHGGGHGDADGHGSGDAEHGAGETHGAAEADGAGDAHAAVEAAAAAAHTEPSEVAGDAARAASQAPAAPAPVEKSTIGAAAEGPGGVRPEMITPPPADAGHAGHGPRRFASLVPDEQQRVHMFFQTYFLMTGLHGLHVLVGMGLITWLFVRAMRGVYGTERYAAVDLVGLYWHLVDLIWIFLFPLLYLIH